MAIIRLDAKKAMKLKYLHFGTSRKQANIFSAGSFKLYAWRNTSTVYTPCMSDALYNDRLGTGQSKLWQK